MKSLARTLLLICFAISAHAATISGTVSSENGTLSAMTVAAYTSGGTLAASGGTTASGTYALTLPAGTYKLLAYDPTGAFATAYYPDADSFDTSASIALTASQNVTNINFRLVRSGFITGKVSASNGGAALSNVTVAAYNLSGTRRGFTNSDAGGNFTLALPPGTYKLIAYDDALHYVPSFFNDASTFNGATAIDVVAAQSSSANFHLALAAQIGGKVSDRNTLAPLPAMRITAYANDGSIAGRSTTAADGTYAMAARAGELRLVADDPNGLYATTYVPDAASFATQPVRNAIAGQNTAIDVTMVRGGRLAGRITDRISGAPRANLTAVAYNADGTTRAFTRSNTDGTYSIVVPPGDLRVGVFDSALVYLPRFHPDATTFGAAVPQHVIAQQTIGGLDFALTKGARITVHVVSRASAAPLVAITVGAYDLDGHLLTSALTDANGDATLLLAPATVKLVAFDTNLHFVTTYYLDAPTFAATQAISFTEAQSFNATFAMTDAGRITGTTFDAATFAPLGAMHVIAYDLALNQVAETVSDGNGVFRLAVPTGTYFIAATDPAHRHATVFYAAGATAAEAVSVHVNAGSETGPLELRLPLIPSAPAAVRHRAVRK